LSFLKRVRKILFISLPNPAGLDKTLYAGFIYTKNVDKSATETNLPREAFSKIFVSSYNSGTLLHELALHKKFANFSHNSKGRPKSLS